uniref:SpoVT-AbrB domain-containing protein n=1 Tax=Nicotiana tabacum TaxID=4097 RepID=A0A1S4BB29_TOBAC
MASEMTKGQITLPMNIARTIQNTKFHVIEGGMRYNALLRRPWINNMKAVPLTLHQVMKFPTSDGVKIVYGEQHAAKEMYTINKEIEDDEEEFLTPLAFITPDDSDATKSTIEELEQVILIEYLSERK